MYFLCLVWSGSGDNEDDDVEYYNTVVQCIFSVCGQVLVIMKMMKVE